MLSLRLFRIVKLRFFRKGTVNALKAELERRGLAGRGNKAELVARMAADKLSKGGNRVDSVASSVDVPDPRLVEEEPSAKGC